MPTQSPPVTTMKQPPGTTAMYDKTGRLGWVPNDKVKAAQSMGASLINPKSTVPFSARINAALPNWARSNPYYTASIIRGMANAAQGGGREVLNQLRRMDTAMAQPGSPARSLIEQSPLYRNHTSAINAPGEGTGRGSVQAAEFMVPSAVGGELPLLMRMALAGGSGGAVTALQGGNPKAAAIASALTEGALSPFTSALASRLYRSALKPSTTMAPEKVASLVKTGIENKIPVSEAGIEKLGALVDDLNQKISDVIASDPKRPISPQRPMQNIAELRSNFSKQVNPNADVKAVNQSGKEFLSKLRAGKSGAIRNMTAQEAQEMKQGTYRALGKKSYGELKGASVEAQKALARGLKEEITAQFPEIASLNAKDSALYDLQGPLERAVNRISNHQMIGIGTPLAAAGGAAATGKAKVGIVSGAIKAVLDDPVVKSRLAMMLSKSAKIPFSSAMSRVAAYAASLATQPGGVK